MGKSASPIDKLNERHKLLALHLVQGSTIEDAAEQVGLDYQYATHVRNSPMFKLYMDELTDEMRTLGIDQMLDQLRAEFTPTIAKVRQWRDQNEEPNVSLGACNTILDRIIPKRKQIEEEHTTVLRLEGADIVSLLGVVKEYRANGRAIETTATTIDDDSPQPIVAKTIDEIIAEANANGQRD
jgi:hypothetical protein